MYHAQLPEPQHALFEAWCDAHHIVRPSVRFGSASSTEAGLGLFATRAIAPGETCISVPVTACISERNARDSVIGAEVARENEARMRQRAEADAGTEAAAAASDAAAGGAASAVAASSNPHSSGLHRISPRSLFYLYLIHARHATSSPFSAWLVHGVPRSYDLPLSWSDQERAQLQGTNLGEAVTHRLAQLRAKFQNAVPALRARNPELFPAHIFNESNWAWAHATYSSRGFPAQLLDPSVKSNGRSMLPGAVHTDNEENGLTVKLGTASAPSSATAASASASACASTLASGAAASPAASCSESSETLGCLIPYLDLTNHRFRQRVTWTHHAATSSSAPAAPSHPQAAFSCAHVSFASGDALRAGDEIWNNYGAKPNEELLMGYGFTLRDNEADCLTLALAAAAIPQAKRGVIQAAQIQLHHVLSIKNPVPLGLLQLMRACAWDTRAVQETSALWLPVVAPELLPAGAAAAATVDADANARALRDLLSVPSLRTELVMLSTLRSLLLGRLRRLQLFDPASSTRAQAIVERSVDPTSPSFEVHTADAAAFSIFRAEDERAREINAAAGSASNYHIECALNYRIGQREVLLAALKQVDAMSAEAAVQVAAEVQKEQAATAASLTATPAPTAAVAAASSSDRKSAPSDVSSNSKRRKTGKATSSVVDTSVELPAAPAAEAWVALLPAYTAWLHKIGAYANADWSSGAWRLLRECSVASVASTASSSSATTAASSSPSLSPSSSSVLLAFPPSFLLSSAVIASSASFAPCASLVSGLEETQLAVLFLLHERSRGRKSQWSPWIDIVAAMPSAVPLPTPEEEADLDSLSAALPAPERSLLDLYTQLFPALSDAEPKLFKPAHHTFARFLWAARVVQERWVQFRGAPGEVQAGVVPVPLMPASSVFAATVAEELPAVTTSAEVEDDEPSTVVVLRSMVPLAAGSFPTLCASAAGGIELVSRAPRRSHSSHHLPTAIRFGSLLEFRRSSRAAQLDSTETGSLTMLPLRALSEEHQALFARLGLEDESEEIVLRPALTAGAGDGSGFSSLLCAVVQSFLCSGAQLRARCTAAAASHRASPGPRASASVSPSRVDDSDEESEEDRSATVQSSSTNPKAASADASDRMADAAEADTETQQEGEPEQAEEEEENAEEEAEQGEEEEEADPPQWLAADESPLDEASLESSVQSFLKDFLRFQPSAATSF